MPVEYKILEANVPFAESIIWDINRTYYQDAGLSAWSESTVPHNMTSNAYVGKTYAGLILGFLRDIAKNKLTTVEKIYIVELGSGHGRLAFHILSHLEYLISLENIVLPSYCYVLTDIVESNLTFFDQHHQFQKYLDLGLLDTGYFDGTKSKEIVLKRSKINIHQQSIQYPLIAIANYFFDSLPNDLYFIQHGKALPCNLTVESYQEIDKETPTTFLKHLKTTVHKDEINQNQENNPFIAQLLAEYSEKLTETYVLIPRLALQCMDILRSFSKEGLLLISMDKGFANIADLAGRPEPEIIRHGSFSLYVNFHALGRYCDVKNGLKLFAASGDSSLQMACMLMLNNPHAYTETLKAYDQYVSDFGPDDYNVTKKMLYRLVKELSLIELIAGIKLGHYDSTLFLQLLPFIKKKSDSMTKEDRSNLSDALHKIDQSFFDINEPISASYEIAGLFYDLGYHQEALDVFDRMTLSSGNVADIFYNKILCYYQLRQDKLFIATLIEAKLAFPNFEKYAELDLLDLSAV
jgi:tetratricopeptide (TPR) repeat protein